MTEPVLTNTQSRVFIKDPAGKAWHLFTLKQTAADGSIYFASPEFDRYEWLGFSFNDGKPVPVKIKQGKDGKISFHGSGQVHVRSGDEPPQVVANGHYLLKPESKEISLRHLFTVMPKKPTVIPKSPALARKTDQVVESKTLIHPFFTMAFALPRQGLSINVMQSMHVDEMPEIPGAFLGMHLFPLTHHDILLLFYYTTRIEHWPTQNLLQFLDGIIVPVFRGREGRRVESSFVIPQYTLKDKKLGITLNMSGLPDQPLPPDLVSEP